MGWTTPTDRSTLYKVTFTDWNIVQDDLAFLYGDTGWTNLSAFTNGWGAAGSAPGYILLGRTVWLRGALTAGTANAIAATLPVGYRPTLGGNYIVSIGSATVNMVNIDTGGHISPLVSNTTWLSQISFPVV